MLDVQEMNAHSNFFAQSSSLGQQSSNVDEKFSPHHTQLVLRHAV